MGATTNQPFSNPRLLSPFVHSTLISQDYTTEPPVSGPDPVTPLVCHSGQGSAYGLLKSCVLSTTGVQKREVPTHKDRADPSSVQNKCLFWKIFVSFRKKFPLLFWSLSHVSLACDTDIEICGIRKLLETILRTETVHFSLTCLSTPSPFPHPSPYIQPPLPFHQRKRRAQLSLTHHRVLNTL